MAGIISPAISPTAIEYGHQPSHELEADRLELVLASAAGTEPDPAAGPERTPGFAAGLALFVTAVRTTSLPSPPR